MLLVAAAELAGFAVPAVVSAWVFDLAPWTQLLLLPAAGLIEGTALGAAQVGGVVSRDAALHDLGGLGRLARVWVVLTGGVLAVALLGSIGGAQAFVVRRVVVNPSRWVLWTGLGWCAGLAAFFLVASPLWHEGQALASTISVGVGAAVVMAVVMAAVTGRGVLDLVAGAGAGATS